MSSDVSVMECVFQHVNCVMATRSVVITVMNTTVIATTVSVIELRHVIVHVDA